MGDGVLDSRKAAVDNEDDNVVVGTYVGRADTSGRVEAFLVPEEAFHAHEGEVGTYVVEVVLLRILVEAADIVLLVLVEEAVVDTAGSTHPVVSLLVAVDTLGVAHGLEEELGELLLDQETDEVADAVKDRQAVVGALVAVGLLLEEVAGVEIHAVVDDVGKQGDAAAADGEGDAVVDVDGEGDDEEKEARAQAGEPLLVSHQAVVVAGELLPRPLLLLLVVPVEPQTQPQPRGPVPPFFRVQVLQCSC